MKKKIKIEELKIQSFVTTEMKGTVGAGPGSTFNSDTDPGCGIISPSDHCCDGHIPFLTKNTCNHVYCASDSPGYCPTEQCGTSNSDWTCTPGSNGC